MRMQTRVRRGSATMVVVIVLVVAGLAATLVCANRYNARKRMLAYQQRLAAEQKAEADRKAAAAEAARLAAEEEAARVRAEEEEAARKQSVAERRKVAAAQKAVEKKAKTMRFEDAEQAFIEATVEMWTKPEGAESAEPTWCLLPRDGGEGLVFEVLPGKDGGGKTVCILGENGATETMTAELFQSRFMGDNVSWFVLRDGKALLRPSARATRMLEAEGRDRFSVPMDGEVYDIAAEVFGDAAKTVKVYRMKPPALAWDVAFITKKGVTVPLGKVPFGEPVTSALFRPAVTKLLEAAAVQLQKDQAAAAKQKGKVASSFTPSSKRTHFLYDKGTVKRTVEGLVYVPRKFKPNPKAQNVEQHKAEWQALYDEALRQEKSEAAERAAWEKARTAATSRRASDVPVVTVQPEHIEAALKAGSFIYSTAAAEDKPVEPTADL